MDPKLLDRNEIAALLGGAGHPPICQLALAALVKQGMPIRGGLFDPQECLAWYIGKLRREELLGVVEARMLRAVETASTEMVGKSSAEIRRIWRRRTTEALCGIGEAST